MITIQDRVIGTLLGLASGDRIGGPLRMALYLSESLIENSGFKSEDVFQKYYQWYIDAGFDTGPTARQVFEYYRSGIAIDDAVLLVHKLANGMTAGCNPMHRAIVLALSPHIADKDLANIARQEAKLTHYHPIAGNVSASTAILGRKLICGMSIDDAINEIETDVWLDSPLSNGGFAPDVFNSALHFLSHSDSFEDALVNSLGFAGANNYCPVVVGALAGAYYGQSEIYEKLLSHCKIMDDVYAIANQFSGLW
ncbi:MAG: hypothetical protein Phog2KO_45150 [Phototrophicaceae bacterium]